MRSRNVVGFFTIVSVLAIGLGLYGRAASQATSSAAAVQNVASAATNVESLRPAAVQNIANMSTKTVPVTESPNSPVYYHIDKAHAVVHPKVPAGDNGALMKVELTAPGTILNVTVDCHGSTCPWTYPCSASTCAGHSIPIEYHNNNTAIWWAWTNDGNNSEYVFAIHYH